jgi:hypothetical protein
MGGRRSDVAVWFQIQGRLGRLQILIEVGFLLGQGEAQPCGEDLVMAVAQGAVRDIGAYDLAERLVNVAARQRMAQGR